MKVFSDEIFEVVKITDSRTVCVRGVGRLFIQNGFPISLAVAELNNSGIETSYLHVVDELLKNGWLPKTVIARLKESVEDSVVGDVKKVNMDDIHKFCFSSYEDQREMIFNYLWKTNDIAIKSLKTYLK